MGLNLAIIGGWLGVGAGGLMVLAFGIMMLVGTLFVGSATRGDFGGSAGSFAAGAMLGIFLFGIIGLVGLGATVLTLVGQGMCLQVPGDRNQPTWGMCLASFICACVCVLGFGGGYGMRGYGMYYGGGNLLMGGMLIPMAALVLWVLFCRCCSLQIKNRELADRFWTHLVGWMIFVGVCFVLGLVVIIMSIAAASSATNFDGAVGAFGFIGVMFMLFWAASLIGTLALAIWLILLMTDLKVAVDRQAAKVRAAERD